ncbi:hypothetical protein EXVG_00129 [Emiliania huxleyi virus 202]|nr:hypothetical protein EXVG_00129 [Emiliania huxleyi virus 202]AHA54053.1 putative membrane protein [Emiliania huxleyi virus 18]AHA55103.1 putative membrane protein [Emiliania huxleyi virus 156]
MEYKDTFIIILSVLLLVTISVLVYLIFSRGQGYFPTKWELNNKTQILLDTFSSGDNNGIFDILYDKNATIDEKQTAAADAWNILNSRVNDIKNSTDEDLQAEIVELNKLKSVFDRGNNTLRAEQIQSRGLDKPIVSNLAMNASRFVDWMRPTPISKYPNKTAEIGRDLIYAFDRIDAERAERIYQEYQEGERQRQADAKKSSKKKPWNFYKRY